MYKTATKLICDYCGKDTGWQENSKTILSMEIIGAEDWIKLDENSYPQQDFCSSKCVNNALNKQVKQKIENEH